MAPRLAESGQHLLRRILQELSIGEANTCSTASKSFKNSVPHRRESRR
jgi:hypothetical protein